METKMIAVACFVGGMVCLTVALIFAPTFWWLGVLAGMASGYLAYDFKEVVNSAPIALRSVRKKCHSAFIGRFNSINRMLVWFKRPHPFAYAGALVAFISTTVLCFSGWRVVADGVSEMTVKLIILSCLFVFSFIATTTILSLLACFGAEVGEGCVWNNKLTEHEIAEQSRLIYTRMHGYREMPLTYKNAARWTAKGILVIIEFFLWRLWVRIAIAVWSGICDLGQAAWKLFRMIHSMKRIICATDGTLGGALCYLYFGQATLSFPEQIVTILFGGILGAAIGVAHWEIVSKRILRVA